MAFTEAAFPRPAVLNEHGRPFASGQNGMSMREFAAITLKVPTSGTKWLDEMITEALLHECAIAAMSAMIGTADGLVMNGLDGYEPHIADAAYNMAKIINIQRSRR